MENCRKKARVGTSGDSVLRIRIGSKWFMCDLNLLRSMSEKIRSHYKYLRYDRDGKPLKI